MSVQLTEVQAWEEVARRFVDGEVRSDGLCWVIQRMWYSDEVSRDVQAIMSGRIDDYLDVEDVWAYEDRDSCGWLYCVKDDEGRALAALWLMCEAAEEQGVRL